LRERKGERNNFCRRDAGVVTVVAATFMGNDGDVVVEKQQRRQAGVREEPIGDDSGELVS
jgi:hypothetical protein